MRLGSIILYSLSFVGVFTGFDAAGIEEANLPGPPIEGVRLDDGVFQPSIHVYTYGHEENRIRHFAKTIKEAALGDAESPICYRSKERTVRLAVQTEARFADFVDDGEEIFYQSLERMITTLASEGFAVHLLLSIHDRPLSPWEGIEWKDKSWPDAGRWIPYQPCRDRITLEGLCPYDRIFDGFHKPVIEHLVDTGLSRHLTAIYLFNEFDFVAPASGKARWPRCDKSVHLCRNEAVAYTTARGLQEAAKVAGDIPIGAKFLNMTRPWSAYAPAPGGDQLSYIINNVMGPNGFVFAFDNIWSDSEPFEPAARARLEPLIGALQKRRFIIGEFAHRCVGEPGKISSGRWTNSKEMVGIWKTWPESRATNLFAFNATGREEGCYALFDQVHSERLFPGADQVLSGLWDQVTWILGTKEPEACESHSKPQ